MSAGAASCTSHASAVGLGSAARGDVVEVVDASASVTARAAATLSSPAAGTVAALAVAPGDTVAAGQVLAVIDAPAAQRQLQQARSALAAASRGGTALGGAGTGDLAGIARRTDAAAASAFAAAREAAGHLADPALRSALLAQIDAAQSQYDAAAAAARTLVAAVQGGLASLSAALGALVAAQRTQAQAAYDLAKSTVDSLTLRAPIAGRIQFGGSGTAAPSGGSLADLLSQAGGAGAAAAGAGSGAGATAGPGVDPTVEVGTQVAAGTAVLTVVDTSQLGLLADVDETDVLLVSPGVTAQVELDAAPGARYDATVRTVDLLPTTSARGGVSYRVRLALGAGRTADGTTAPVPRPGMSAVAHLAVRRATGAVTVPAAAVFSSAGHDAVWAVRAGKAVLVPVRVGVQGVDQVEIVTGLVVGDAIVVRGVDQVRAGQALP